MSCRASSYIPDGCLDTIKIGNIYHSAGRALAAASCAAIAWRQCGRHWKLSEISTAKPHKVYVLTWVALWDAKTAFRKIGILQSKAFQIIHKLGA